MSRCIVVKQTTKQIYRLYCSHPQDTVKPAGRLKKYLVDRFTHYLEGYENLLKRKSPKAYKIYKTFSVGVRELLSDTHTYVRVSTELWTGRELHTLTRRELEIYQQMPGLMVKVTPLLIVSVVPGGGFIFPIAYMFPRLMLTHHFWTDEQKKEFALHYHKHKLDHFHSVLDHMHKQIRHISDHGTEKKISQILYEVEHSKQPSTEELLNIKFAFEEFPYLIDRLSTAYIRRLGRVNGMSFRRSKLKLNGLLLLHSDLAILREGAHTMTDEEVERACFCRGLNPVGLSKEEQIAYLKKWTSVTKELDEKSISLLLHCPVLLAYNEPTNRQMMEPVKTGLFRRHQNDT